MATCTTCGIPLERATTPGRPAVTCSPYCLDKHRAKVARDGRERRGLISDGHKWRALHAIVEDIALGLLPFPDQITTTPTPSLTLVP